METNNKYYETGSSPCRINLNNSAKEYSTIDSSNPPFGFLDTLYNFTMIEKEYEVESPIIDSDCFLIE